MAKMVRVIPFPVSTPLCNMPLLLCISRGQNISWFLYLSWLCALTGSIEYGRNDIVPEQASRSLVHTYVLFWTPPPMPLWGQSQRRQRENERPHNTELSPSWGHPRSATLIFSNNKGTWRIPAESKRASQLMLAQIADYHNHEANEWLLF